MSTEIKFRCDGTIDSIPPCNFLRIRPYNLPGIRCRAAEILGEEAVVFEHGYGERPQWCPFTNYRSCYDARHIKLV